MGIQSCLSIMLPCEGGANDTWSEDDLSWMCVKAKETIYVEGRGHALGEVAPSSVDLCDFVWYVAYGSFGDITTAQWKTFFTNWTYPPGYVVEEQAAKASRGVKPVEVIWVMAFLL